MVRCITADLLYDKNGIVHHWCLLIIANRVSDLVHRNSLRSCLENLRTTATSDLILCFHIVDLYRGKMKLQWWFELMVSISQFPRIRFLDEWTHTFSPPVSIPSDLSALHIWSPANLYNRSLP